MTRQPHAHCHFCGAEQSDRTYPRTCLTCGGMVWDNPVPVAVVCAPMRVEERVGLLVIRRGIEPGKGKLALVGGFCESHETWQQNGAREVREETGIEVDPAGLEGFWFVSTHPRPNRVLLFSTAPESDASAAPGFEPNTETEERGVVFGPDGLDAMFAFDLHAEAARRWFAERGATGPHDYRAF
ncbi:MAG: NUDIX domain-containing protein [Sandaracinaceae bacterium]